MARQREFRVLVATDGSAQARSAVATAVRFPWPEECRAQGLVARQVRVHYGRSILLTAVDRSVEETAADARRALARRWPSAEVSVVDLEPARAILQAAGRFHADVIVVGWRGHGPVRRFLTGSVSRGVLRGAKCAVLVVRRGQRGVGRVVIGFDGSAHAQRAVEFVSRLIVPEGGEVTLFRAIDQMAVPSHSLVPSGTRAAVAAEVDRINKERVTNAKKEIDRAAAILQRAGWSIRTATSTGAPLHDLLATADSVAADVLVVGARGASGVRHLLLGSVAEGAVNRSRVPVLVVR